MTEREIFTAALGRTSTADRAAYLDRACGGDTDMRRRIEELLGCHDSDAAVFDHSPADLLGMLGATAVGAAPAPSPARPVAAGTVIAGRFVLEEVIGEGGMGTVYRARQVEPVRREVALKLIKAGLDSAAVLARFEAERQALALMDHPHIARVFDGGVTGCEPGGAGPEQPFFVMEYVRGAPITRYCDDHRLAPRGRLKLFVDVCRAVQHAHLKGIIHRDLKPSNVLVTEVDGRPTPKVIDFGLARAAGAGAERAPAGSPLPPAPGETGLVLGTPEYMSPEQAGTTPDVDARTDVYALGILLYELLTGTTPRAADGRSPAAELLRLIRESTLPRPSTRLSAVGDLPAVAANRGVAPGALAGLLRGELDWVVMKALERDRAKRYQSPAEFAAAIQRYLDGEAVLAVPSTAR